LTVEDDDLGSYGELFFGTPSAADFLVDDALALSFLVSSLWNVYTTSGQLLGFCP